MSAMVDLEQFRAPVQEWKDKVLLPRWYHDHDEARHGEADRLLAIIDGSNADAMRHSGEAVAVVMADGYPLWLRSWLESSDYRNLPAGTKLYTAQPATFVQDRLAIKLLVTAGFVSEAKANEALNIAHGFAAGPLEPAKPGLVEALKRYGRHEPACATRHDSMLKARPVCDCGFDAALAAHDLSTAQEVGS